MHVIFAFNFLKYKFNFCPMIAEFCSLLLSSNYSAWALAYYVQIFTYYAF